DGLARPWRAAEAAGIRRQSRQGPLQGLCRLYRAPRAPAGYRPASGLSWLKGGSGGARGGQSRPVEALYREWLVFLRPHSDGGAVLQACQPSLSGFCRAHGLLRYAAAGNLPALSGNVAKVPPVGARAARAIRAGNASPAYCRGLRSAARLV